MKGGVQKPEKGKYGSGKRSKSLEAKVRKSGARNPAAVAAAIGRAAHGTKSFQHVAAQGRHRAALKRHRGSATNKKKRRGRRR